MTQITSTNVISKIKAASKQFHVALQNLHSSIQSLYEIYVIANTDSGVEQQIAVELASLTNAPKTNKLHIQIAYLAFFNDKRRASEIGKVLRIAGENGVYATDFVDWVKNRGGLAVIYREPKSAKNSTNNKAINSRKPDYFKFATKLSNEATTTTTRTVNPSPFSLADNEIAVQCVRQNGAGSYETFWAKISESDVSFSVRDAIKSEIKTNIEELLQQADAIAA